MLRAVAMLVLLASSAGCADPAEILPHESITGQCDAPSGVSNPQSGSRDWSVEKLHVSIPDGPYDVAVPVPVSRDGTNIQDWIDASGSATRWQTERGTLLRVSGDGPAVLTWCVVQPAYGGNGCCAEQYLDARFTTERGSPTSQADVHFFTPGSVEVAWEALSDLCGAEGGLVAQGHGTVTVDAEHGAWCS